MYDNNFFTEEVLHGSGIDEGLEEYHSLTLRTTTGRHIEGDGRTGHCTGKGERSNIQSRRKAYNLDDIGG
jgi:hypothetical protein